MVCFVKNFYVITSYSIHYTKLYDERGEKMENVEMNQLISAIGQMMDEKLEPIKQNISSINQRLTSVELTISYNFV